MKTDKLWQNEETGTLCWATNKPSERHFQVNTMHEDALPEDISKEDYDAWFENSTVPNGVGCRIGPVFLPNDRTNAEARSADSVQ